MKSASYGSGRERLFDAALKRFTADGFEGASIRDIGEAAGLTNPALYRHFAGKEELGLELYRRCYERLLREVERAAEIQAGPLEKILAYVSTVEAMIERDLPTILYIDENQTRFWPALRRSFEPRTLSDMILAWLAAGRREGSIARDVSPHVQLAVIMGTVGHWAAQRSVGVVNAARGRELAAAVRRALAGPTPARREAAR